LDADVVLIRGDNGTGKTSVADGLLWLFTGDLPRLAERARGLRKGQDPFVNRYRGNGPARVKLTCTLPDGRRVEAEREGRAGSSKLAVWQDGSTVVDAEGLLGQTFGDLTYSQLSQAVASWGILQQHSLLAALDSGVAMHQRLAEVVGLDRVTRFAAPAMLLDGRRPTASAYCRCESPCGSEASRLRPVFRPYVRKRWSNQTRSSESDPSSRRLSGDFRRA
jgi:hypothetical protein